MEPKQFRLWLEMLASRRRPLVMGVLNVTPDSFSDGGVFMGLQAAVDAAREMVEAGADLIDVGGESTRPGSRPVDADEQVRRVVPVIRAVRSNGVAVTLSIDTTRAAVALEALDAGADVVNDISAGRDDPELLPLVAARRVPVVLMHMQGTPATMQVNPTYSDVTAEVIAFLRERVQAAVTAGLDERDILVDPGIGFGKTPDHNLHLLRETRTICDAMRGRPVLIGSSRKGFIGKITNEPDPARRQFGTAATIAWVVANGAAMVRVHDVGPMAQVVTMVQAIARGAAGAEAE